MKEISFININKKRWSAFDDQISKKGSISPDDLASNYILLTDDLSYARTFYPESGVVSYLNSLSSKAHALLYRNKREKSYRLIRFCTTEHPLTHHTARKDFLSALLIFVGAFLLGLVSSIGENDFVRVILGDAYVNMTLDNIAKGDPLGVYGMSNPLQMFFFIAYNNIRVSIIAFLFGVFTPLGTSIILVRNGIMVGAFLSFFFQFSLGEVSAMAVLLHGTIELSAIVLAGGAGILMGRSLLFPGTYSRKLQFVRGAVEGSKIIIGLIPFFILAAIIESYVTRHYNEMAVWLELAVIVVSFALIVFYFVIYPIIVHNNILKQKDYEQTTG